MDRSAADFTLQPAVMHGAVPGAPMYFVEEGASQGVELRVVRMTNKLSPTPVFTDFTVPVFPYNSLNLAAPQPGVGLMDTGDTRILNAAWRGGRLVAAQTVGPFFTETGVDEKTHARWYDISTAEAAPALTQMGELDPGPGLFTYYPAVEIAPSGDLGLTYMQSAATQFVSMYVTGRSAADPPGTMQTPVAAKLGETSYFAFDLPVYRAGDYSGIAVDPVNGSFWAASEYATAAIAFDGSNANWGTWVANFSLSSAPSPLASLPFTMTFPADDGSSNLPARAGAGSVPSNPNTASAPSPFGLLDRSEPQDRDWPALVAGQASRKRPLRAFEAQLADERGAMVSRAWELP